MCDVCVCALFRFEQRRPKGGQNLVTKSMLSLDMRVCDIYFAFFYSRHLQ